MTAFLCKEILYQNLFKSNHNDSSINDVLSKHKYQLSSCGRAFRNLEDLVDCNHDRFGTDFSSFSRVLESFASDSAAEAPSSLSSRKVQYFLLKAREQISQITKQKSLSCFQSFLFAIAEIQKLRIKVFTLENGLLSTQNFGNKSARKICLFSDTNSVRLVEAASDSNYSTAFMNFTKGLVLESENSFSDCGEICLSLKKETSAEKETVVDQLSIHENIKQVHEELFGDDMFDNFSRSDDADNEDVLNRSSYSSQSENLRNKKEINQELKLNNSSFNLALHDIIKPIDREAIHNDILSNLVNNAAKSQRQSNGNKKFQSKVIYEEKNCRSGKVKFYSEEADFGFLITKEGEEFFVHGDDLAKDGIDTRKLAYYLRLFDIQVNFRFIQYQGKAKVNRKAVDIQITGLSPVAWPNNCNFNLPA